MNLGRVGVGIWVHCGRDADGIRKSDLVCWMGPIVALRLRGMKRKRSWRSGHESGTRRIAFGYAMGRLIGMDSPQYGDRAVGSRFEDVRKIGQGAGEKAIYRVNWMNRGADRRDKGLSQEWAGVWTERNMKVATNHDRCMWLSKTGVSLEDWSEELEIVDES
ncbi:hypothetical protein DFH09DRAFT_1076322 [Mycena vulgaris]|nr:hypothetical protein DFH09DRAFT_1076322 [Mycena vulgaris]